MYTSPFFKRISTTVGLIAFFIAFFFVLPPMFLSGVIALTLGWVLTKEWPLLCPFSSLHCIFSFIFYPIPSFLLAFILNQSPLLHPLFGWAVCSVAIHDSTAYVFGTVLGRHALAPTISPKKTIEGFWGGWIGLFAGQVFFLADKGTSWLTLLALSGIVATIATLGDLFESYLKRKNHIKDAGTLLPGHGGVLDRFDSLIAVLPFVFVYRDKLLELINYQLFL